MSKYTENFPNLSTYDFDTIMCQLRQVCGADTSGMINAQFLSRPTTAKDIAQLFYCTKYIMDGSINLQNQYVELYNFVKDFFENLNLQEEINKKLEDMLSKGEFNDIILPYIQQTIPPTVVNSIDDMTNKYKSYVLKENGHLYQYLNNEWTDTEIVFGGNLSNIIYLCNKLENNFDFNNVTMNSVYSFTEENTYINAPKFSAGILWSVQVVTLKLQIAYEWGTNKIAFRNNYVYQEGWREWQYVNDTAIFSGDYLDDGTDIDNTPVNSINMTLEGRTYLNAPPYASACIFTILNGTIITQMALQTKGNGIALRRRYDGNWNEWKEVSKPLYYRVCVLGDSISDFTGYNDNKDKHTAYYPKLSVDYFNQMWFSVFNKRHNNQLEYINAITGSSVSNRDGHNDSFIQRMTDMRNGDLIILECGTNDQLLKIPLGEFEYSNFTEENLKTFRPALAKLLDYMTQRFENSKIIVFQNNYISGDYESSMETICEHYGVEKIKFGWNYEEAGTVHPSKSNMIVMANSLDDALY